LTTERIVWIRPPEHAERQRAAHFAVAFVKDRAGWPFTRVAVLSHVTAPSAQPLS
jgi:hypothetical protein